MQINNYLLCLYEQFRVCISEKERVLSSSPPFVRVAAVPRQVPPQDRPRLRRHGRGEGAPCRPRRAEAGALRDPARADGSGAKSALRNGAGKAII